MKTSNVWALCCIHLSHIIKKMAKHSATFIPIICSLFYLGQWTSRRQPPGAWWKTRSGHRWFILYFYVPDNAFSVVWIAASSGFEMTLHHTCNNCTISTLSDKRDFFPNRTKKTFSIRVHFGYADDDTFSLFWGIYSPSSYWESC